jgi:nucleoside-diphosphate-sugar epimerase
MNFLVTGVNGLIGYELVKCLLLNPDNKIIGITNEESSIQHANFNPVKIDLSIKNNFEYIFNNFKIDIVIHLAQSKKFREFPEEVYNIWNVNTNATLELLEYSRKFKVKMFIYTSSGGVYGIGRNIYSEEYDIKINKDLGFYLSSKIISEILISNYSNYFNTVILRPFFVYGKRQNRSMLIPRLVDKIKNSEPIIISESGGIKINPIHVNDFIHALLLVIKNQSKGIFNVCGDEILSIQEISQIIADKMTLPVKFLVNSERSDDLIGDNTKIKKIGFIPRVSIREGIKDLLNNV